MINGQDLRVCMDEDGVSNVKSSYQEWLWLNFLEKTRFPSIVTNFNCKTKMKVFNRCIPDGVVCENGSYHLFYFNGCAGKGLTFLSCQIAKLLFFQFTVILN